MDKYCNNHKYELAPNIQQLKNLCGKHVEQHNLITGETWSAQKLVKIEIREDGIFAILNEDFNIEIDLTIFNLILIKESEVK